MGKKRTSKEKKVVIKSLVDAGMSYREIQKITPVSLSQISRIAKEFESNKQLVEHFRKNKANILADLQRTKIEKQYAILGTLSEEELKKLTFNEKMRGIQTLDTGFGINYDKERVERGETTENVGIIYAAITDLQRRKAKKREQNAKKTEEKPQ